MTNTQTLAQCWTNRELDADLCSEAAVILLTAKNYVWFNPAALRLERRETTQEEIDAVAIVRQRIADAISADPDGDHSAYNLENYEQMLRETINAELGQRIFSSYRGRVNTTQAIELYFAREEAKAAQSAEESAPAASPTVGASPEQIEAARKNAADVIGKSPRELAMLDYLEGKKRNEFFITQARQILPDLDWSSVSAYLVDPNRDAMIAQIAQEAKDFIAADASPAPRGWAVIDTTPDEAPTLAIYFQTLLSFAQAQREAACKYVSNLAMGNPAPDLVDCPRIAHADAMILTAFNDAVITAGAAIHLENIYSAYPASHYQRVQSARDNSAGASYRAYMMAVYSYSGNREAMKSAANAAAEFKRLTLIALRESIRIQREYNRQITNATNNAQVYLNNI